MSVIIFDFGGTSVKYGTWSQGQLGNHGSFVTPTTWKEMKASLSAAFTELKTKVTNVQGVALSLPGVVDNEKGEIRGDSAIRYIHRFPIKAEFTELFDNLPVAMENDANCAALAELWQGSATDVDDALVIALGTGVGGSVIVNRQLVRGKNLVGGEFGFMQMTPEGTWSTMGTVVRTVERYNEHSRQEPITGKELFDRAEAGDELAQSEVDKFYHYNAIGIYNLISSFNPDRVILAGGVSARQELPVVLTKRVTNLLKWAGLSEPVVDIQVSRFSNDANLIGAVKNFMDWHPEITIA
ncbi:ROK family protein [Lapidilactobacillus mulanensis]|uniref:ROK family protein n=1 Tax=Lapidilactobacillus mulanensis TaxID=2485999 RepID=A0ABW4DQS6_9LACO|nr:ROK family protein [Lapidilactobacillus mulanensis]